MFDLLKGMRNVFNDVPFFCCCSDCVYCSRSLEICSNKLLIILWCDSESVSEQRSWFLRKLMLVLCI